MALRIGFGFDVHRLAPQQSLIIGGVTLSHSKGTVGHSDGDVLLHAICDALLGAAGLGDIGQHFPDTDPQYKNIDSTKLLQQVYQLLQHKNSSINNIDNVICLQRPKLAPHLEKMQKNIINLLSLQSQQVNIKATTTEKIGIVGREEGIVAYSTALLQIPSS